MTIILFYLSALAIFAQVCRNKVEATSRAQYKNNISAYAKTAAT